jgi:hypothetical protein
MAGYSATPQLTKLGIGPGTRLRLIGAGTWQFATSPHDAVLVNDKPDVLIAFVRSAAELAALGEWGSAIFPAGACWVAWPRKAAGHASDVTENAIRDAALPLGLVDVKVAAIDEDRSGLKVVWRKERRA